MSYENFGSLTWYHNAVNATALLSKILNTLCPTTFTQRHGVDLKLLQSNSAGQELSNEV